MLDYITSYLSSNTTPGQAGNVFWALSISWSCLAESPLP